MSAVAEQPSPPAQKAVLHDYPWYSPRFWHGMCLSDWWRLAREHRFRFHPARWAMASTVTCFAISNSMMRLVQQALFRRAVERTEITKPPVFILGHWRSGTTYLHELMMQDQRFNTPTSYQCFQPHHFIISQWLVTRLFWWLMPGKRPMDNVSLDWNSPQEDEFALCAMGVPSSYRSIAFPNDPPVDLQYLNMQGLSARQLEEWQQALLWFVKLVTYYGGGQVLLKSPPHTGRLKILAELFPGAKFIHLVRDPYSLYPSNVRLWRALNFAQGFQLSEGQNVEAFVFECMDRMYSGFHEQREQVDPEIICDLRYEDLVRDPVGQLRGIYERLDLGDFSAVEPNLQKYAESRRNYRPNRHELDEPTRATIADRWSFYFDRYGYEK